MESVFTLESKNRGPLTIRLNSVAGCVQRIEAGTSTSGKNIRMVSIQTDNGVQQFKLSNPTITLAEAQNVSVIYYETDGFIKKVAGFHNHSKKGSYFLCQPKDYFEHWLQVRPIAPVIFCTFVLPLMVSFILCVYALTLGIATAIMVLIGASIIYARYSKKYVLVSGVHLKSVLLQLMDGFKEFSTTND